MCIIDQYNNRHFLLFTRQKSKAETSLYVNIQTHTNRRWASDNGNTTCERVGFLINPQSKHSPTFYAFSFFQHFA